jgi:thioredoxin 1
MQENRRTMSTTNVSREQGRVFAVGDRDFEEKVLKSDQPVIVDFWAEWCPPCHALAPTFQQLSEEYRGRVRFAKLDVEADLQVPAHYGVQAMPTLLMFKNGKVCARVVGPHPSRVKRFIEQVLVENGGE